jgi:hypothetical protein
MKIDFTVEGDKVIAYCNGKPLQCRWMLEHNHKVADDLVDLVFYECKEQLKEEIKQLKPRQSTKKEKIKMNTEIIGTHIAISWYTLKPFHYGTYKGRLKKGYRPCTIDVDWKIKVFNEHSEQVGTDEVAYWLCDVNHILALANQLNGTY